ncbi:MAG: metallophosphoesterase, partial [Planctomycetes bacterium]|nr:metallophosphoesterase [Planctomycetota bacterium]
MSARASRLLPVFALALAAAATAQQPRLDTDRKAGKELLRLPKEEDAFGFVVFGDRTGGPVEGIEVLKVAVADTNLLDPDLVFTVGDLVNGYNATDAWLAQAKEFKDAMGKLRMPWFPVAGNHDIYWRGDKKPVGEHEGHYETTFGPLWYSVRHKQCLFVALYSDEGDPKTGEKNFNKPECQRMSPEQFAWLDKTLADNKAARHVFVFLHHPRWLAQYGDDWERVHGLLAKAGNVTAVFAGHIHRMRYDGVKDGIQYYTVASVGAHLEMEAPQAGYLHQYHVVTVRPEGITVAALPVGTVIDPKAITGEISEDCARVHAALEPKVTACVAAGSGAPIGADGSVDAIVTLRCNNPARRPVEYELIPVPQEGWTFTPDHQHVVAPVAGDGTTTFAVRRTGDAAQPFVLPEIEVRADYLAADRRVGLPRRRFGLQLPPPADLGRTPAAHPGALVLDGTSACASLPNDPTMLPDGAFTVELWVRGE